MSATVESHPTMKVTVDPAVFAENCEAIAKALLTTGELIKQTLYPLLGIAEEQAKHVTPGTVWLFALDAIDALLDVVHGDE